VWADLVLRDGNVLTMDSSQPRAEAVAIRKDRIVEVGVNEEVVLCVGEGTEVISLKGMTVVPGFIDTHVHVADFGRFLTWVDLRATKSIKEMQNCLRERAQKTPKGKWIIGHGWDQNCFSEGRLPTLYDLDVASPNNPVILYHQCGQLCVVNSKALELAGVTKQTSVTSTGAIDKNAETGELTGVLRDSAMNLVWKMVPEPSEEELLEAAGLACEKIVKAGVTSAHWMVSSPKEISIIQKLRAQKRIHLRVYMIIPVNLLDKVISSGFNKNVADNVLRVGGAVIFADGYLSARTAALFQPYSDSPAASGRLLCTKEEMNASAIKIRKASLQLVMHAMGDKAVDAALTTIEETSREGPRKDLRDRIEQAAVLNEGLLQRMKKQKVIVSVQPRVIDSEFSVWSAAEHLGPRRASWVYPIKTLLKAGIRVISGSDCPMEPLSPLLGVQTAVTRESFPEERVTIDEALRMYTIDAAYSTNEEKIKGSIEEGKIADLAVLSRDPFSIPPSELASISVELTIVGGRIVYSKH
jgi:predicted amidohydrolase YtcJ